MVVKFLHSVRLSFIFWLARRLPTCRQMAPIFSESLDRRLLWRERIVMKLHLFVCDYCVRYMRQIAFLRKLSGAYGRREESVTGDARLSPAARERIKAALKR